MIRIRSLIFIVTLCIVPCCMQGQDVQVAVFGGSASDEFASMVQCADGGFLFCGTTGSGSFADTDIYVVRTDENLNCVWNNLLGSNGIDRGTGVAEAPDGSIYICGYSNSYSAGGYDIVVFKLNADGQQQWMRILGGADWDISAGLALSSTGTVFICGQTYSMGAGNGDGYLAEVDENGELVTEWTFGFEEEDALLGICSMNGSIVVCGFQKQEGIRKAFLARVENGSVVWSHLNAYGNGHSEISAVAVGNDQVYACGSFDGATYLQGYFQILDENGNELLWDTAEAPGDYAYASIVPGAGGFLVAGRTEAYGFGGFDGLVYAFTDFGGYEGGLFYGTIWNDRFQAIVLTDDGFAVCGKREAGVNQIQAVAMHYRRPVIYSEDILAPSEQGCLSVGLSEEKKEIDWSGFFQVYDTMGRMIHSGFTENLMNERLNFSSGIYVLFLPEKGISRKVILR